MVEFNAHTVTYPLIGGILLGIASSLNLWLKGRITGISGIIYGLLDWDKNSLRWRSCFLAGLISSAVLTFDLIGFATEGMIIFDQPEAYVDNISLLGWILAGFFVGFGTKLGSGCTSGHGLCGIPRFSKRSVVSVITFMALAIGVATLKGTYQIFSTPVWVNFAKNAPVTLVANVFLVIAALIIFLNLKNNEHGTIGQTDVFVSAGCGLLFGFGLMVSGMTRRSVVLGFLTIDENWNPALAFTFCGGLLFNFVTYYFILKNETPSLSHKFDLPTNTEVDGNLIAGAAIFGIGWGIAGLCPGPALFGSLFYLPHVICFFMTPLLVGQYIAGWYLGRSKKDKEYEPVKDKV